MESELSKAHERLAQMAELLIKLEEGQLSPDEVMAVYAEISQKSKDAIKTVEQALHNQ